MAAGGSNGTKAGSRKTTTAPIGTQVRSSFYASLRGVWSASGLVRVELLPQLRPLPLGSGDPSLPSLARLLEVQMLLHLGHDAGLFAGLLESPQGLFEWLVFLNQNPSHTVPVTPFTLICIAEKRRSLKFRALAARPLAAQAEH